MIKSRVILELDLSEELDLYNWLKDLMQNPLYDDESIKESKYREKIFNALNTVQPNRVSPTREIMREAKVNRSYIDEEDIPF
jgi:hypothetical protein